ncbi:salt tolerance down-regulator-domain-containing protein [Microdochium trichocladiopsis]|uniref:Stress response protein NST1 n=1 Tax=Microdochium trichocladiopsis TaxID=1682393 RepID=A0A9P9BR64_9PEZI|nr:salt tolerance down-regulator-domain-containing protein [Microdochium trichocladiopsis]KAH7026592.1 salt tolerance down-regulator-domain-containing protein [Microdochium trichocladiopsis]
MPTVNRPAPAQGPAKATSKYSNKDGTKYISVPKATASTAAAQPSPTTTTSSSRDADSSARPDALDDAPAPTVNRKKQKRRAKAAAKAAAEQAGSTTGGAIPPTNQANGSSRHDETPGARPSANGQQMSNASQPTIASDQWGDETESEDDSRPYGQDTQSAGLNAKSKKSRKKKKNKSAEQPREPSPAPISSGISREKIWNTSGPEERERIKQFWLGLGEDERKSLVKVEKDAVLKKMKEQQKHTCSCSVCGRKRTAIEEELEGLYDAYYEELESFANQPHNHTNGPSMFGGPKRFGPLTGLHPPGALPTRYSNHHPSRGRIVEHVDNDEEDEEDDEDEVYSEEEEDDLDDEDDEDEPEEIPRNAYQNEFFTFGQSLTVKGGILTVADDLLKNDGKKFIEMMEQLAERRMAREEDAKDHYGGYGHGVNGSNLPPPHNHPPPDEEEYDEDEEEPDDDYASQDYDDEDEEEDTMTEEQRMEEGRRMFQIFAARMFEQRVLTAYREKVAKERQEKLLEELAAEDLRESQKAAKKAKDAQKRKDKAAQKKQAQLEEKARKEAAKAAEDAARRAEEAERIEEAKRKAEDKRKKKEAQKKAEEEDRLRKEAERQRRAIEQKERQAEQERKAREAKEREKQAKEERQRKEQEAREQKERETRERREKHERDKREKEQRAAQAKAERDAKEKQKQEDKASLKTSGSTAPAGPAQVAKKQLPVSVPAIPHHPSATIVSPQIPVATPVLPKAPTPAKPRTTSQEVPSSSFQTSQTGLGQGLTSSPSLPSSNMSTPGPSGPSRKTPPSGSGLGSHPSQQRTMTPLGITSPPGLPQSPYNMGMPPAGMQFPPGIPPLGPGFGQAIYPPIPGAFRPGGLPPPGLGGQLGGRPFPMPQAPPGFHQVDPLGGIHSAFGPLDGLGQPQASPHSRQASLSFDSGVHDANISTPVQPIARPAPIGRPSVSSGPRRPDADPEDLSNHLGSSALLDDDFDEPFQPGSLKRGTAAPGTRQPFVGGPFMDSVFGTSPLTGGWNGPLNNAFSPPPGFGSTAWPPSGPAFGGPPPGIRPAQPRSITIRQILVQSCKDLQNHAADSHGWIDLSAIKGHVDSIAAEPVTEAELLDMCETEGNAQNGGGTFDIKHGDNSKVSIKYDPDMPTGPSPFARNIGAPGEIGSPIVGHATTFGSRF